MSVAVNKLMQWSITSSKLDIWTSTRKINNVNVGRCSVDSVAFPFLPS